MKNEEKRWDKGITLIALVVTIVIIIILAAVAINLSIGENGIFNKSKYAKDETLKQVATERINLKITNIQIDTYTEEERMPTLQEVADIFCEDNEIEYVTIESKVASLEKITVNNSGSIYTKLKDYSYEFEINSSLQLASIDGIKIGEKNDNEGTISKEEYEQLKSSIDTITSKVNDLETINNNQQEKINELEERSNDIPSNIKIYYCKDSNVFSNIELETGDYKCIIYKYIHGTMKGKPSEYYVSFGNNSKYGYEYSYTETLKGDYEWSVTLTPRTSENEKCYISFETTEQAYYQLICIKLDNGHS